MIKFLDVIKVYDNNTLALKNVNLTIEKGEFAFLVGPSGSGKSIIIMATHVKGIVDIMRKRVISIENGMIIRDEIRGTYDYDN